ncbi:MAG: zinc ABC transporter substrate-binding protein [Acidobacteriota bacterium]
MSSRCFRLAVVALSVATLCLGLAACGSPSPHEGSPTASPAAETPHVAVAIAPYAWLVEQIEPHAEVTVLVTAGETPETFQPTDAETARLLKTRLYLRAGVPFERGGWLTALERAGGPQIVDLQQDLARHGLGLRSIDGGGAAHSHADQSTGGHDPHVWLAPAYLTAQAHTVTEALAATWPERATTHRANLETLRSELGRLEAELGERLAPYRGRSVLVLHPSWGYFTDAYGLRQLALEIAGQTPSDGELTALRRAADAAGVRTLFVPPQLAGPRTAAIVRALGLEYATLDPLARDVVANLRHTAELLVASFSGASLPTTEALQ